MRSLSFRIRKKYFDDIVAGKKTVEYRRANSFWMIRVANILCDPMPCMGVFLCGKRIHRREITCISKIKTPDDFSAQGKKDVNTKLCFAFYLGAAIQ